MKTTVIIRGKKDTKEVWINNIKLSPKRSQELINHSPDGFNWGYAGSGPAQLSLAILSFLFVADIATKYYQKFKLDVISRLPFDKNFRIFIYFDYDGKDMLNWEIKE